MKFIPISLGALIVVAETSSEASVLKLMRSVDSVTGPAKHITVTDGDKKQVHKRHLHTKVCPDCRRKLKGWRALGIHRAKVHGIKGRGAARAAAVAVGPTY